MSMDPIIVQGPTGSGTAGTIPVWSTSTTLGDSRITEVASGESVLGNLNNYFEVNVRNTNAGTTASSDVVCTADTGTATTNFIDLGINSSGYTGGIMGAALDGYLYTSDQNLNIGAIAAAKVVRIVCGGSSVTSNTITTFSSTGQATTGTISAIAAATQDAIRINPRAGGTSSFIASITTGTLTGSFTYTIPATAANDTFATLGLSQTFTGSNTFRNATGQIFQQASTQDGVLLRGRAGGTSSFSVELTPTTLAASRVQTLQDKAGTVALRDAGTTDGIFDWSNANSITTTATAIVGRLNVCSGTTADYTVTIPTPVGINGQTIVIAVDAACTRWITLSAAAGTIAGAATRMIYAREDVILRSNGTDWERIGGTHRPITACARRQAAQSITPGTWTQIVMDTSVYDNTSALAVPTWDSGNGRLRILRPGIYVALGFVSLGGVTASVEVQGGAVKNSGAPTDNPNAFTTVAAASSTNCQTSGGGVFQGAAGEYIAATIFHSDSVNRNTRAVASVYPCVSMTEVPSW